MVRYWCFNCQQSVENEEVFRSRRHRTFLGEKMAAICPPWHSVKNVNKAICICQDCVFYRIQVCSCCRKGAPLCMFTLEEWFASKPMHRKCLDCTALNETLHVSVALPCWVPPSQFVLQCHGCSKFKYICSFAIFHHMFEEGCCHRAIRDGNEKDAVKMNIKKGQRKICLTCQLTEDIDKYKAFLKRRYNFKVSLEPALAQKVTGNDNEGSLDQKSYASVLIGNMSTFDEENKENVNPLLKSSVDSIDEVSIFEKSSVDSIDEVSIFEGPAYVIASLKDFICKPITTALLSTLTALQEKIELELKFGNLSCDMWRAVLQHKFKYTTHLFSLQATERTDFSDAEVRWAYIAVYMAIHASLVYDTMVTSGIPSIKAFLSSANTGALDRLQVCCFGAGPGSEVIGLYSQLPISTKYHLFDNCLHWEHNAKALLESQLNLSFTYTGYDVTRKMKREVKEKVSKAQLFTFVKFLSAVQNLHDSVSSLRTILSIAPEGSLFLFIDNTFFTIKNFIESLVFPDRNFNQAKHSKENDLFRMYTSYAEYRLDSEEAIQSHPDICELFSTLLEWVDRPPLVDVRVYLFIIEKKRRS